MDADRAASAKYAIRKEHNRTLAIVIVVVLIVVFLALMILLFWISLTSARNSNKNNGGGGGGNVTPPGGCTNDGQCPTSAPKCDTSNKVCVVCLANGDCSGNVPVCKTSNHTCVQCIDNSTCLGGETCNLATNQCVECIVGSDCGAGGICTNGVCVCNVIAPPQMFTYAIVPTGGGNCLDFNLTASWEGVPGADTYILRVDGTDTTNGQVGAPPASVYVTGITGTSITGGIGTIFNYAPQGYPTQWCSSIPLSIQVQAVFACYGAGPFSPNYILGGGGACC